MTNNSEQQNVPYEDVMQRMQDRYVEKIFNEQYNGRRDSDEVATLEEFVTDEIDDGSDEQERLEQEASNDVLIAFSRLAGDTDVGGGSDDRRTAVGVVPFGKIENISSVGVMGTTSPAPDIVTRGYLCNSSPDAALSGCPDVTPEIRHGGFDGGAKNCFFGTWNEEAFVTLIGALESGKTSAACTHHCNKDKDAEPEIITLAGRDIAVYPSGARISVYYAYHICFEGYDVFIHKDMTPKNNNPQIWVDYRAESILKYGSVYGAQQVLLDFLSELGFTKFDEDGERVSRLDVQIMIDVPVRTFANLFLADQDVGKGRDFTINGKKKRWGKRIETFYIGTKGRVELCIYDKRLEMNKPENGETAYKYQKTKENIGAEWWNDRGRPITRIEFRFGRDALKALGVESLEDFRKRERAIVQFLTHKWFRLLEKPKVRGTENDAAIHPDWERVRSLFFQYFSCAEIPVVEWEKPTRVSTDCDALNKQGMGCLLGEVAARYGKRGSVADLGRCLQATVERSVNEEMYEKHYRRVRRIEVERGIELGEREKDSDRARKKFSEPPDLRLRR